MSDSTKALTAAQAAALVDCKAKEVLDFKEFDDRVVVVTIAGQKLTAKKK